MANDQTTGQPVVEVQGARVYGNEVDVGRGMADSGVPREEIFLTTKVPPRDAAPDALRASAEASLRDLGTDYVDLLLLHWASQGVPIAATLEAMQDLHGEGRIRHFGVSNFSAAQLREALDIAPVFCDQIEYHPFVSQQPVLEVAEKTTSYRRSGRHAKRSACTKRTRSAAPRTRSAARASIRGDASTAVTVSASRSSCGVHTPGPQASSSTSPAGRKRSRAASSSPPSVGSSAPRSYSSARAS
jgi:hypothetical protein